MSTHHAAQAPQSGAPERWSLALVTLLTLCVHAAAITDGFSVSLFAPDGVSQYFDAYASSLAEGRLDVDPYHIGNEAFVIEDRTYGYWGLTPAIPRMLLNALAPSMWGHWTRLFMLLSAAVVLAATHALVTALRGSRAPAGPLHLLLLLAVGLGSSALFLPSRPNVYHEATALGAAFALASYAVLARYLQRPSLARLAWLSVLCALALHARVVAGLGVLAAMGCAALCLLLRRRSRLTSVQLALATSSVFGSYLLLSWLKFGTLLSLPIAQNLQSTPERLARTGGHMLSFGNFVANTFNHLAPWNVRLLSGPLPIAAVPPSELLTTAGMDYDWREPIVSVVAASPALIGLAGFGVAQLRRAFQPLFPLVAGAALSATVPLLYFAITQRYAHDMLPLLVVLSAGAVAHVDRSRALATRTSVVALSVLAAWSAMCWWEVGASYHVWAAETRISPVRADIMVPAYEREVRLHPQNVTALGELAGIHLSAGRLDQARQAAQRALAVQPDHVPSLLLLAAMDARGNPAASIQLLRKAAQTAPEEPVVHAMLGQTLLRVGDTSDAIEHLQKAIQLAPADPVPRQLLEQARGGGQERY